MECDVDSLDTVYTVSDYYMIGGAYGMSTEENMMREIYKNGPIVASFEPSYEFMEYDKGIYSKAKGAPWVEN